MSFDLTLARAKVIEHFIEVEQWIGSIVCQHYFKEVRSDFMDLVLRDEYFSFALKRRILVKIVNNIDNTIVQRLNRLNTIRNYFAHCGGEYFDGLTLPEPEERGYTPDPRHPKEHINFESLYNEFSETYPGVCSYLSKTFQDLGGWIVMPSTSEEG